jgi:hypothetical protein
MHGSVLVFDPLARSVARVSLLAIFATFAVYTVAYLILIARYRLPRWTSAAAFLNGRGQPWFRLLTFCQVCALATPLFFVAFVGALSATVAPRYAALGQIALAASTAFAVLSSVYYVVQLRLATGGIDGGGDAWLDHLLQLNPAAVFTCVNIVGWTLFFAIACLCAAPALLAASGAGVAVVGGLLIVNGVICLLGLVGYLGRVRVLNVLYFNGMGVAVLAFSLVGYLVL